MNNDIITPIITPDGIVDIILQALGINYTDVDFSSPLGITLIVIACVIVLAIVFFIVKALTSIVRSGKY